MKKDFVLSLLLIAFGCHGRQKSHEQTGFPVLKRKYLGQKEPGHTPEIFAPPIVSSGKSEINAAFSPDFKEFYYSVIMPTGQFVIRTKNDECQTQKPDAIHRRCLPIHNNFPGFSV